MLCDFPFFFFKTMGLPDTWSNPSESLSILEHNFCSYAFAANSSRPSVLLSSMPLVSELHRRDVGWRQGFMAENHGIC